MSLSFCTLFSCYLHYSSAPSMFKDGCFESLPAACSLVITVSSSVCVCECVCCELLMGVLSHLLIIPADSRCVATSANETTSLLSLLMLFLVTLIFSCQDFTHIHLPSELNEDMLYHAAFYCLHANYNYVFSVLNLLNIGICCIILSSICVLWTTSIFGRLERVSDITKINVSKNCRF